MSSDPATCPDAAALETLLREVQRRETVIVDQMLASFTAEIPDYSHLPPQLRQDIRRLCEVNLAAWLRGAGADRAPSGAELDAFASSARRRAADGFPLEALLHAYRLGARVGWQAVRDAALVTGVDPAVTLDVAAGLMRYVDVVSSRVAQAYLVERERMVTDSERRHHELAELLLADGPASPAAQHWTVRTGMRLAPAYLVALVLPPRAATRGAAPGGAQLLAVRLRDDPAVVAIPRSEDVLLLWPAPGPPAERVSRLAAQGYLLAAAGPAAGPLAAPLAEATAVARAARLEHRVGLVWLADVALSAWLLDGSPAAAGVVRGRLAPLLATGSATGSPLLATLRAFLALDGSLERTAQRLQVHRNTVGYRLNRVRELTGLDPARLTDAFALQAALLMHDAESAPSPGGVRAGVTPGAHAVGPGAE